MAWEAASRGLRVALLEKNDFGAGTSANSLRIVHGGLRYLQSMDILRARASAGERSTFLRIAPHLVTPIECVMPTLTSWKRGRTAMACGLAANAFLTLDRNWGLDRQRRLPAGGLISRRELAERAAGIDLSGATGGARWFDAVMLDPERLCLSFALSARNVGAAVFNHMEATEVLQHKGRVRGVLTRDNITRQIHEIRTKVVADCRGPWIGKASGSPPTGQFADTGAYIKAVNLVLETPDLGCAVGFPARSKRGEPITGRLFFATPFHGATAVGTWYFETREAPDETSLSDDELEIILRDVTRACPAWSPKRSSVTAVHIGLQPMDTNVRSASPAAIDRPIIVGASNGSGMNGLWQLQTEKWTTARRLAEHVLNRISTIEEIRIRPSATRKRRLYGGEFESLEVLAADANRSAGSTLSSEQVSRVVNRYGQQALDILARMRAEPSLAKSLPGSPQVIAAELTHALEHEMPETLEDLMLRRLGLGATTCPPGPAIDSAAAIMGEHFDWTTGQIQENKAAVRHHRRYRDAV